MKPLWKVKGFEQQTSWKASVLDCGFSHEKMNKESEADMYMPPLMHVRSLFFFFFNVSSLSSSFPPPLSSLFLCLLSRSLSVCLRVMLRWCCVWSVCVCLRVLGPYVCTSTTGTCVSSCARGAGTHGDVLNRHTGFFSVPHHTRHTSHTHTHHDHNHSHSHNDKHHRHHRRHHIQEGHGYSRRLPALVLNHSDIQSRRGYH